MLRTEVKTTTLIDRYKEENTETKSQTEVDNGVHPLHWATSLGPSPMGTNPINGFKMVQMVLASTSAFAEIECWTGSLQDSSLELTTWTSKDKEAKL